MIRFENVSVSFGELKVYDNLTLTLPDRCLIRAPSGRGKTTLLRLAAGLINPDSGTVTRTAEKVSFLFQDDRLLPWLTVRKNITAVLPKWRRGDASSYIEAMELSGFENAYPENLSGGQRRRIAIARALAYGGDLLILDEPFKGLDEALVRRIAVEVFRPDVSIIMTSHSELDAELFGGEVVAL